MQGLELGQILWNDRKNGKLICNFEFQVRLLVTFVSHSSEISYEAQFTFNGRTGQMQQGWH